MRALLRRSDVRLVIAVLGGCLLIWVLRRPGQVSHPYVWAEESFIVRRYLEDGWAAALSPVQGYLVLPTSFFVTLGSAISFAHLPALMYVSATAIFVATILMLLIPDSRWGGLRTRCALAGLLALSPANPEVFGVLLYGFWWCTLWPLIILGWRREHWWWRVPLLVVAGLSSPAAAALAFVFALAWFWSRRRADLVSCVILLGCLVTQLIVLASSDRGSQLGSGTGIGELAEQVVRTAGYFPLHWLAPSAPDRGFMILVGAVLLASL